MSPKAKQVAKNTTAGIGAFLVAALALFGAIRDPAVADEARETTQTTTIAVNTAAIDSLSVKTDSDRQAMQKAILDISVDAARTAAAAEAQSKTVDRLVDAVTAHIQTPHGTP